MRQNILLPGLVGVSLLAAMMLAPVLASAVSAITSAKIEQDKRGLEVKIGTASAINTAGTDNAFGYGVLNDGDSLMVATTHGGVLDSATQSDASDPIWHNHYVQLTGAGDYCAPNAALGGARLEVAALTFESPGEVNINGASIKMEDLPGSFTGTNPLDSFNAITMNPGTSADTVVSFTLSVPDESEFHVCVENVTPFAAETD
jgi:hypothetical protein